MGSFLGFSQLLEVVDGPLSESPSSEVGRARFAYLNSSDIEPVFFRLVDILPANVSLNVREARG